jgi:hypothetical protein
VLCVLYSKDWRQRQDNQDKVQIKHRERKKSRQGHGCSSVVSVVCCHVEVLREGPIPRLEVSFRLWCIIVCDLETSRMRRPWPALGCCATERENMASDLHYGGVPVRLSDRTPTVLTVIIRGFRDALQWGTVTCIQVLSNSLFVSDRTVCWHFHVHYMPLYRHGLCHADAGILEVRV